MKSKAKVIILLLIIAGSFFAGYRASLPGRSDGTSARKILYYVDPMNPGFRSEKPGIAPCGMALEPVYADSGGEAAYGTAVQKSLPPGSIRISSEKQQLIGVKTAVVEKSPWSHNLRVLGRVAPDETRVFRINAAVNGWIENVSPVTTGSFVKKDQLLATFYSLEYRTLLQSYFNIVGAGKANPAAPMTEESQSRYSAVQLKQMRDTIRSLGQSAENSQADYYRKNLFNYGMTEYQMEEMERTRKIPDVLDIRAPISGFILSRNVSPGLRFDRGVEFFRIADLSRIWILVDVFENEASFFKPGMRVRVELPYLKKNLYAQMSNVLPQFDAATRTLKIRLETDNQGFIMRPDMFANVEIPVSGPPAIIVPADAVVDSGLKKTVFVDRGNGYFEPRQVETGHLLGERVEVTRGLMPGEKIVVSGNFLIDSESRMRQAAAGIGGKTGRDSVCGMNIDEDRSKAAGFTKEYQGKTYFFCSPECRDEFIKAPRRYTQPAGTQSAMKSADRPLPHAAPHDHAAHGAMKSENRPAHSEVSHHDQNGMKKGMPAAGEPSSNAAAVGPVPLPKMPVIKNTMPDMPPQMPNGPETGKTGPGMSGPASFPSQAPQSALPGAFGPPVQKTPGSPPTGVMMPQPSGAPTVTGPQGEGSDPPARIPQRRARPQRFPGVITPGTEENSSLPGAGKNRIVFPGGGPAQTEPPVKTTDGRQNHD